MTAGSPRPVLPYKQSLHPATLAGIVYPLDTTHHSKRHQTLPSGITLLSNAQFHNEPFIQNNKRGAPQRHSLARLENCELCEVSVDQFIYPVAVSQGSLVSHWSVTGQSLVSHWSVTGQSLVSHWSVTGQSLVSHWSVTGQSLVSHWSVTGQSLVSHWSVTGQSLVSHWSVTGQSLVSHWSVTGQSLVSHWS